MDYEKAYKEALNWIRSIYPTLTGSDKEDAEHYFPELHESEDERIREWIANYIHHGVFDEEEHPKALKAIEWLERQKEQKPAEIKIDNPNIQKIDPDVKISTSDSSTGGDRLLYASWRDEKAEQKPNIKLIQKSWYMEGYHDREFNREPKWIIKTGEGGPRYEENPKYGQPLIEQRPTEEQLHNLNEAIKSFRMDGFDRIADSLHSLYNCILTTQEQKSAEWSVKGRRGRIGNTPEHIRKKAENFLSEMEPPYDADDICSAYETGAMESIKQERSEDTMDEFTRNIRNLITDKLTVHTKSLDGSEISSTVFIDDETAKDIARGVLFYVGKEAMKNPDREIPEWSEEDEQWLESIIGEYEERLSVDKDHAAVIQIKIDFLKSLRPQSKEELSKILHDEYNKGKKTGEREGYTKGYEKGYKDANESLLYHFPVMPTPPSGWGCDGTHCTNPQMDCINCPKKSTGGIFNTALSSGDPTLKAEWKPSEEQMDELLWCTAQLDGANRRVLAELYEQLKKLK